MVAHRLRLPLRDLGKVLAGNEICQAGLVLGMVIFCNDYFETTARGDDRRDHR